MNKKNRNTRGQVLVIVALVLVLLLAVAGLAIDVGMAYGVKAKLNAAVDAAALAAGKVCSQGTSAMSTQAANFFAANYPSGLLGSTVSAGPSTNAVHNGDGSWTVTVTATAIVPTNFAGVVGWPNFTVTSSATSTVRTLDLILVLDSSGSLASPSTTFPTLQAAAKKFIQNFDQSSDRIGLIHFAGGAVTDVAISTTIGFNPTTIDNAIDSLTPTGGTTTEEAMRLAQAQLDAIPAASQSSLRAIVLFTDGAPNAVASNFCNGTLLSDGTCNGTWVLGALYSETTSDPDNTSGTEGYCNCSNNCINPLITDSNNGDLAAIRMFAYTSQNTPLNPPSNSYCNIQTLPVQDWSGTVNLQSYNAIRQFDLTQPGGEIINDRCNVNRAARNMLENIANSARSETPNPINIYTIGYGALLAGLEVDSATCTGYGNNELGTNILQRLANVQGVDTYNQNQPTGLYVYAGDPTQLNAAFNQIASAILRLSK